MWEIFQDLAALFNVASNHEVQKIVKRELLLREPSLAARITFDSEADRFCAMAEARDDIEKVAILIQSYIG
jgi:hypothetical protein